MRFQLKKKYSTLSKHLMTGGVLKVEYCDHHKGCDTSVFSTPQLKREQNLTKYFETWWYENLSEYLTSHDAFGDTITVEFHRGSGVLEAIPRLKCGDDWYGGGYDQHSKEEIIAVTFSRCKGGVADVQGMGATGLTFGDLTFCQET